MQILCCSRPKRVGLKPSAWARTNIIWIGFALALLVPMAAALSSPLLAWREPVYIAAGIAGVLALGLLLVQPLLIGGLLPGLSPRRTRLAHRWVGALLVLSVAVHVAALWITSPPDVVDALLFVSPTSFSLWGVVAMWAVFLSAVLALARRHLRLRVWRKAHTALAVIIVIGTVVHAVLIDGTMETFSKAALCALVVMATIKVIANRGIWTRRKRTVHPR